MGILDLFRLDGKVAVITGAGRGIGAACARAFAEAGASVVVSARTEEQIEATAASLRALGGKAIAVRCDVMKEEQLEALVQAALQHFGRLDIVVNNAGGSPPAPALKTSTADFVNAFRFNVGTAFALSRIAAPHMVATAGGGSIINISSVAGQHPSAGFAAYGTAKSGLSMLTRELAQEFAPKIRVNAIAVGSTKTEALNTVLTPEIEQVMVRLTPMGRLGDVEDISACALYLAAPASAYLTGDIIGVNGGLTGLNLPMPRAFG
jgi:7-alpha-hydroxysteroid dehydrogenase